MTHISTSGLIALDGHTKHLFAEQWHTGPIEVRFRLKGKAWAQRVFVGRLAPLRGVWSPIIQEETLGTKERQEPPCFIGHNPYGFGFGTGKALSTVQICQCWDELLVGSRKPLKPERHQAMRTLPVEMLTRCHFDQGTRLACEVSVSWSPRYGGRAGCLGVAGRLTDLRDGCADYSIYSGPLIESPWSAAASTHNWLWAVVDTGESFHHRMAEILRDSEEPMELAFRFFSQEESTRWCEFLGCDETTQKRWEHLIRCALRVERGGNALPQNAKEVQWRAGSTEALLVDGVEIEMPATLEARRAAIHCGLGLERRYLVNKGASSLTQSGPLAELAWGWAHYKAIMESPPSSHEIMEATTELSQFL